MTVLTGAFPHAFGAIIARWARLQRRCGSSVSLPGGTTTLKLCECEETDTPVVLHGRPYVRRVVAPGCQEQANIVQVGMGGDVLQGLQVVLDKPQSGVSPVYLFILGH